MIITELLNEKLLDYLNLKEEYLDGHNKTTIFLFVIGSFPHQEKLDHENPQIYKNLRHDKRFRIVRILIDQFYDTFSDNEVNNYDENTFIVNHNLTPRDYSMILDFCNFVGNSNVSSSLSIILEFTSLKRPIEYTNLTKVYISPSDCMADTKAIEYNPIIENEMGGDVLISDSLTINNFRFFTIRNDKQLRESMLDLIDINLTSNVNKIDFIRYLIIKNLQNVQEVYHKLLNYMKVREEFETSYIKGTETFDKSLDKLLYRIAGYYNQEVNETLVEFKQSYYSSLNNFLKDKIKNIFKDCVFLEHHGQASDNTINSIDTSCVSDDDIKNLYDRFHKQFVMINE